MNWFCFSIIYALLLFRSCTCIFYPPLFWQRDNCAFRRLQDTKDTNITKEYYINVYPATGMNIICPNYVTVNTWLKQEPSQSRLLENFWLVDKDGYDKCIVNEKGDPKFNRLLMVCDNPLKIKSKLFAFHPNYNTEEPTFETGQHYYFISTSRGYRKELSTRKVSGPNGGCKRYHMKLHIYVCDPKKEDCVWEMPKCDPSPELYKSMRLIDGKLPAPTRPPVLRPKTKKAAIKVIRTSKVPVNRKKDKVGPLEFPEPTQTTSADLGQRMPICKKKKEGTSIQLILNFVLGGVALFMAIVIIILVCGLANDKSKSYKMDRPASALSSIHGGTSSCINAEVRYSDGHAKIYPILVSRTPPTSPNVIVAPYVQRMPSSLPHTPPETPLSNDERQMAFTFPLPGRHTIERTRSPSEASTSAGAAAVRYSIERSRSPSEASTSAGEAVVRHSIEGSRSPSEASTKEFGSTSAGSGVARHSTERSRSPSESSTKGSDSTSAGAEA